MIPENVKYISEKLAVTAEKTAKSGLFNPYLTDGAIPIPYLLTRLFEMYSFPDLTRIGFDSALQAFNDENGSGLQFSDFEEIQWVRTINDRIYLPHLVWSLIWRQINGHGPEQAADKPLLKAFLTSIFHRFNGDRHISFPKSELERVINSILPGLAAEAIRIMTACSLLHFAETEQTYTIQLQHHNTMLVDEIASGLWAATVRQRPDLPHFREYIQKICYLSLWPRSIVQYFSDTDKRHYCTLFEEFIRSEPDLLNSDVEFEKAVLDSQSWKTINLDDIPMVQLDAQNPYDLILLVDKVDGNGAGIYTHQETRSIYALGLLLLLQCDFHSGGQYKMVNSMLKDIRHPYIVVDLFEQIIRNFQEIIPYLLTNLDTLPLAFLALDRINYRHDFFSDGQFPEEKLEESAKWKDEIRHLFLDHTLVYLQRNLADPGGNAQTVFMILEILLQGAFAGVLDTGIKIKQHQIYLKNYTALFNMLVNRRISFGGQITQFPFSLEMTKQFVEIATQKPPSSKSEYLQIGTRNFHLLVDLLKALSVQKESDYFSDMEKAEISTLQGSIADYLTDEFQHYFTDTQVTVARRPGDTPQLIAAKRGIDNPFIDTMDWGFLFLILGSQHKIDAITNFVQTGFAVLTHAGINEYSEEVTDLSHKLKVYLRILLLAKIGIAEKMEEYKLSGQSVESVTLQLESTIATFAGRFCRDDMPKGEIDIFADKFGFRVNYLYTEDLLSLLFKSINVTKKELGIQFIQRFFDGSKDLGRLLYAMNELKAPEYKAFLAEQIEAIKVDDFISSVYHHELMDTLIYAANSDNYWQKFGAPLIERAEKQLSTGLPGQQNPDIILFELRLLLAFKAKDFAVLQSIPMPDLRAMNRERQQYIHRRMVFFQAVYKIYNDNDYDTGMSLLEPLVLEAPSEPDYPVHRFRARTLKAIAKKDISLFVKGYEEWESSFEKVEETKRPSFQRYSGLISFTKLHYLGLIKDYDSLDRIVRELPASYKFDQEVLEVVTNAYKERNLMIMALEYLNGAYQYYSSNTVPPPDSLDYLKNRISGEQAVDQLRTVMALIGTLPAKDVPRIFPNSVNDQKTLQEFILRELTLACEIMVEKIEGLRNVGGENRYSDLLMAIMRARFRVWGWSVEDQSRMGTAKTDAGEVDFTIRATGPALALIEALHYYNDPKGHIIKVRSQYSTALSFYYILIYLVDSGNDLDTSWSTYVQDVADIDFMAAWSLGGKGEQVLPIDDFSCAANIKVGKTIIDMKVTLFHVMVKIS